MREWQQTKFKDLIMPDAVYYQTIWAVRDLARMEAKLEEMLRDSDKGVGVSMVEESPLKYPSAKPTEKRAVERAVLEMRVAAIHTALDMVPPPYRQFIMDNIIKQKAYSCFPNKLWRIWKQRFLYNVAVNLEIM